MPLGRALLGAVGLPRNLLRSWRPSWPGLPAGCVVTDSGSAVLTVSRRNVLVWLRPRPRDLALRVVQVGDGRLLEVAERSLSELPGTA